MARRALQSRWDFGEQDLTALLRESKKYKGESLWNDAWRRLRRNRTAFWSMVFLAVFGVVSFLAPILPLPSPVSLDLSAGDALPPTWPWSHTRTADEWDPGGDDERGTNDADTEPGVLPARAVANLFNDGWRHQAVLHFETPSDTNELDALRELVREVSGRTPRIETRPAADEGRWDQFLMVPLRPDDKPRVDYVPTDVQGEIAVWVTGEGLTYDLNLPRVVGDPARWSVQQRTRRGALFLTPAHPTPGQTGHQFTFQLARTPDGEPVALVVNGVAYAADGAPLPHPPPGRKERIQVAPVVELVGVQHEDLGMRVAAATERRGLDGSRFVDMRIEDGYTWKINSLDLWMIGLRSSLFGSWQTGNWMGKDENGRDILARIVWGSRTSILVALAATACSLIIGVVYGAFSGLVGGRVDNLMMRIVDILYSVPFIFVVIFLITIINEYRTELEDVYKIDREKVFYVVIGAIYWLTMARVVRGQVLSLKNSEFIEAARVTGASTLRILFSHLVPNVLSIVIVYLTLTIPAVMLFEAFLSFLGLGIEPPKVSWGLLAVDGTKAINPIRIYWWLVVFPALAMGVTLLSLNVLGDGLRDALDPKLRGKD